MNNFTMIPYKDFKLSELSGMNSTASEIDNTVDKANYSNMSKIAELLYNSDRICVLGDSITFGVGVENKENVWSNSFKEYLREIKRIDSIGFETALNDFSHNHTVVLDSNQNWTPNKSNRNSINGFSYDSSIANSEINIYCDDLEQSKATLYFTNTGADSTIEIYLNATLIQTLNLLTTDNSIITSSEISIGTTTNHIKVKLINGKCAFTGVKYYNSLDSTIDIFATGGRRIGYITEKVKQSYLNYDFMFFALSYNDVVGGSTDLQKEEVYTILTDIATHYKANNKSFVYLNTLWDTLDVDNWVLVKLNDLFSGYDKYAVIDYKSSIIDSSGSLLSSNGRINILKQWIDVAHPNDLGHNRILRYLLVNIFNDYRYLIGVNNGLIYKNYSFYNDKNYVGNSVYGCNVLGINNKIQDKANFVSLFGIGNETLQNTAYAIGEYNILNFGNSFALGKNNSNAKTYTTLLGTYAKALNGGVIEGYSNTSSIINQKTRQHRTQTTTNSTEAFLRGLDTSGLIVTNINTRNVLKGNIYCYDNINDLISVFKIDCIITNNNNTNTIKALNGSVEGVLTELNENNVSCRIVVGASGSFTIRVVGNANTLKWISDFEMIEFSK